MADDVKPDPIFAACRLAFVTGRALYPKTIAELSRVVEKYGGEVLEPELDGSLPLTRATHVVANSIDFEQYNDALQRMLPVVRSEWIMHSLSRDKLSQVRPFSPDPRMIFASVTLTCADIPPSDKEVITGAILALGGTESKNLTRLTTHICALSLDHPKCQEARAKGLKCSIVLPHWFDDCFKLGRKIDETPYLLPDPPILRREAAAAASGAATADGSGGSQDRVPIPETTDLDGAVATFPETLPALDPAGRANLTVFQNKKVLLSHDLNLGSRFRRIVYDLIKRGGGRVVEAPDSDDTPAVDACDMFICHYRDGAQYVRAAQAGKDVGNLAWLFHIITNNEWCSPQRRLLHYPVPRHGIPGFQHMVVALSNYGGDARLYLENLIVAAGATYTKSMRMDNTHLITARDSGDKCDAAREWGIQTVNHLWIEESYAQGRLLSVTNPRYTTFPARTNLGEVIGQTFFDEARLRALYYPGGPDPAKRGRAASSSAPNHPSSSVLSDVPPPNGSVPGPHDGDDEETASEAEPGEGEGEVEEGVEETGQEEEATAGTSAAADEAVLPRRPARKTAPLSTPLRSGRRGTQQQQLDKENRAADGTPLLSSASRSAKAKARTTLQDLASDIALYEKEKKRSARDGSAPWGGKRAADQVDKAREQAREQARAAKKRLSSEAEAGSGDDNDDNDNETRPAKKKRPALPPLQMRIVLTGYDRWVNNTSREEADRKKLRQLGIQIVQDTQPCDFLAAPGLVRTMKFLKTLARGPGVLNAQYITDVLARGALLPTDDYALRDAAGEARFGLSLPRVLARARAHRGRLLWNVVVYCMADIKNGADSYRAIAEANGAIFKLYRAHSGTTIRPVGDGEAKAADGSSSSPEPVYLLTSAAPAERALWPRFAQMARDGGMEPRIVAPDWLLDVAMRQELVFAERYLAENFA